MATNLKLIPRAERLLEGKITADMTDSQTTVTVDNPPLITALPSYLEIDPDSATYRELCRVIAVSSSTITLERGLNNGGTGFPHSNNTAYKFKFTSRHWEAVATALESGYLTEDSSYVFTQVSTSSFKITASSVDRTDTYTKGRKIRINGSVVAYVISSSYSNPDTTVVIDDTTVPVSITSIEISIDTKGNTDIFTDIISKNKATGAEINTGTEDAKIVTPKAIADSWINNGYSSLARQAIINGNFDIWQRGVSVAITDTAIIYQADRWKDFTTRDGGTLPTLTRSKGTLAVGSIYGAYSYSVLTTNGAGTSLGNNSYHDYYQSIENGTRYLCGDGKKVTVSFWAKSSIANKKIGFYLVQDYGTGGSPTGGEGLNGTNWTLTSSWVKYTYTFTTNTLAGKTFGTANNDAIYAIFRVMWGSGKTTPVGAAGAETYGGSGTIDIAQVQLCAGDIALPFMPKSFEEELRACQRYYEASWEVTESATTFGQTGRWVHPMTTIAAATATNAPIFWKVTKRAVPTVHTYGPVARTIDKVHCYDGADREVTATIIEQGRGGARLAFTTPNNAAAVTIFASYHWTSESEL